MHDQLWHQASFTKLLYAGVSPSWVTEPGDVTARITSSIAELGVVVMYSVEGYVGLIACVAGGCSELGLIVVLIASGIIKLGCTLCSITVSVTELGAVRTCCYHWLYCRA